MNTNHGLDDPSTFNHVNQIGPSDGGEAMRDQHHRKLAAPALDRIEHASLVSESRLLVASSRISIEGAQECARECQPLAFALRHQNSAVANDGIESVAESRH